ncbi:unnamed protein product, partial [Medioppia subpectinata]
MSSDNSQLTILFTPLDGWGHINACHGLAEELLRRGHRVVFAIDQGFAGKLSKHGFEEVLHSIPPDPTVDPNIDFWADFIVKHRRDLQRSSIEIIERVTSVALGVMFDGVKAREDQYRDIVATVRPDVIVIDSYVGCPPVTESGVPWVLLFSAAPHMGLMNDEHPPAWSGLPLNGDQNEWQTYQTRFNKAFDALHKNVDDWYKEVTGKSLALKPGSVPHPLSPYLNICMTPKELDYEEVQPLGDNWHRVDGFVRTTDETFEIPECLRERSGKLILLSMGSFGCADIDLMIRLTTILAKSEHRFIVSKGPLHDKYSLPDNMWGQPFLPQTAILPLVDLVLTHGGNNTVTETF